ncbi:MAG: SPFH domain-containing protein [Eubacteriales bacterium]|nr:SPFH domain-containing protein [Eubacteriales bacterium]
MGFITAFAGAFNQTLADQWKEYFACESLSTDILVAKGRQMNSKGSVNKKGTDNVITDGSKVVIAEGQCVIIVEDGKVIDFCTEPGGHEYRTGTTPTIMESSFFKGLKGVAKETWERFKFGGGAGKDQRIYYFNLKHIMGNKYGTPTPIPFRIVDRNIGMDMDISVRCNGEFTYRIVNPMLFYTNVCGNVANTYDRSEIDSTLKSELLTALNPVFGKLAEEGIRYSAIPAHTEEIADLLNEKLSKKWTELRGIEVVSFNVNSISIPKEDEELIKTYQKKAMLKDDQFANAAIKDAYAEAMVEAAKNQGGAMTGFMGMNMATGMAGGILSQQPAQPAPQAAPAPANGWTCSCGTVNTGKFCTNCGNAKAESWTCSCGAVNEGKFCSECGAKKPEGPKFCPNCGWKSDGSSMPKFCPECGTKF